MTVERLAQLLYDAARDVDLDMPSWPMASDQEQAKYRAIALAASIHAPRRERLEWY